jgi:hypothetical protein
MTESLFDSVKKGGTAEVTSCPFVAGGFFISEKEANMFRLAGMWPGGAENFKNRKDIKYYSTPLWIRQAHHERLG